MKIRTAICLVVFANAALATIVDATTVFDYGIASESPVNVSGSAQILGANANIFTDTTDPGAVTVGGSAVVAGDISTVSTTTTVSLGGSASVGGVSVSDPAVYAHIHQGVPDIAFPQVDPSVFYPYAVNPVTRTANANLTNICIAANTNPTFTGNTTLYGVIYIKAPNKVTFQGNVQITGVVVTDDATGAPLNTNTITFGGNVDSYPVENLVGDANNFPAIRAMTGTSILAPGFDLTLNGISNLASGCMAANSLSFGVNSGGSITGTMINYSDSQPMLFESSDFTFNPLPTGQGTPAGFVSVPEPATLILLALGGLGVLRRHRRAGGACRAVESISL
jgi:cytoskeletal protein CcmA (bactofilin family)